MSEVSTKPYLIRAMYEWCCDSGYVPHIAVVVDERTQVPREFVKNGEIVLNLGPTATNKLELGNEFVSFQARFGGVAREIFIPVGNIRSIYARENGQGMAFEVELGEDGADHTTRSENDVGESKAAPRPSLSSVPAVKPDPAPEASHEAPEEPRDPPPPSTVTPIGGRARLKRVK
jgi:stringent starvation protein B